MDTANESSGKNTVAPEKISSKTDSKADTEKKPSGLTGKSWLKIGMASFLILLVIVFLSRNLLLGTPVEAYAAQSTELRQTVVASGRVITPQRVSVASKVIGRVKYIPVAEGEKVLRGQLLIQLDNQDELASIAQAETTIDQAQAKLRQQREVALPAAIQGLKKADADVRQLQNQFERIADLKKRNFVSQMQLDEARRNLDVALSQKQTAALQVQTNQLNGGDSVLTLAGVAQARANLSMLRVRLEQDAIRAPSDGVLIARNIEPGDIVQPGASLMTLAVSGEIQIEIQLDEKNLAKIAIGQKALGSADAFSDQKFEAIVNYINPGIDAIRGSVEVKLRIINPPEYLRQDMTVSIDIETARKAAALVVPTEAVRDVTSDTPWVMVVRNKRTVHQPVRIGLRGDNQIEILSGLKVNEPVILSSVGTISVDQRVRARIAAIP
jgi:HlyD family secretion protein